MKISLIGYMGSGKTQVGKALARELSLPWYDLDAEIEKASGYSITETILNKGELHFRQLERKKLHELLAAPQFVLSTGGGTPCYYDNIEQINRQSLSVYLQYSVAELYRRLEHSLAERPLIAHLEGETLREYIGKHLFERSVYYDKAITTLKCGGKEVSEIVNEIKIYAHE